MNDLACVALNAEVIDASLVAAAQGQTTTLRCLTERQPGPAVVDLNSKGATE